jgi:NACHT domain/Trypsin-like peptidase domain
METLPGGLDDLLRRCTVRIVTAKASGTGFFVAPGQILTCAHVVETSQNDAAGLQVIWEGQDHRAKLVTLLPNPYPDLALLHVDLLQHPCVYLHRQVDLGEELYSYGYTDEYPGDSALFMYEGPTDEHHPLLKLRDSQVRPGLSGAPLLNTRTGGVCGVVKRSRDRHSSAGGRAVPVSTVLDQFPALQPLQHQFHLRDGTWGALLSIQQRQILGLEPPGASPIEAYMAAVREYCGNMPYLTLRGFQPVRTLDEMYVPLKVRPHSHQGKEPAGFLHEFIDLPIAEALKQQAPQHLVLLGEPGAGKSTLLYHLAEHAWDTPQHIGLEAPHLPIFIPLRRLAAAEGSFAERLHAVLSDELPLAQQLPERFFTEWPAQTGRRWLILLDGLDEVLDGERQSFVSWLRGVSKNLAQHRVVLTSRPSGYTPGALDDRQFGHYTIVPFTQEQIRAFATRWLNEQATEFLSELDGVHVGDLQNTPLLLMIAVNVYLEQHRLPRRRVELYQQFVKFFLDEAKHHGLKDELGERVSTVAESALARLALAMSEHPGDLTVNTLNHVTGMYFEEALKVSPDEAKEHGAIFVQVMARRSGVFSRRGNAYEFVHPTFREYFTACAVEHLSQRAYKYLRNIIRSRRSGDWIGIVLFVLEQLSDDQRLVNKLITSVYNTSFIHRFLKPVYDS